MSAPPIEELCLLLGDLRRTRENAKGLGLTEVARNLSLAIHEAQEVLDAR